MFNAQSIAVRIERKLHAKGYAQMQDAYAIRANPIAYMDAVLKRYEKLSEEHGRKAADFWEVYERFEGCKLDEFGEEMAQNFANDISALFI